jgi:hypothetical protein
MYGTVQLSLRTGLFCAHNFGMVARPDLRKPALDTLSVGPGPATLYKLLDSLIALRLEIANNTAGERGLTAALGIPTLREVRKILDRAIGEMKRKIDRAAQPKPRRHPLVPTRRASQQHHQGVE